MEKDVSLAVIQQRTASLAAFGTSDLSVQESVDALVKTAVEVNEQAKALKEQDTRVKDEFKRMCKPYTDNGQSVTCYAFDQQMKMTLSIVGGGMSIDEDKLLKEIYDMYGEQVGDKGGKAWRAFCAISDPMDAPRKLNLDKLAYEVAKAQRIASGQEVGEVMVTDEQVQAATTVKEPSLRAACSKMTKGEIKSHDMGELTDTLVLK